MATRGHNGNLYHAPCSFHSEGGLAADLVERPTMVGRERELATLVGHLDAARRGQGSLVLISGEAGIGKTRLVEEVAAIARDRRFLVLSGCAMYESLTPYLPFIEALRSGGLEHLFAEETPRVEGAFLVTQTGLLIRKIARERTRLDFDLFASMLRTVMGFVADSLAAFKGAGSHETLDRLSHGEFTILVERGRGADLAVILTGRENEFLIEDMRKALSAVDRGYGRILETWDGDGETVAGVERLFEGLVTSGRYDGSPRTPADPRSRRNMLFENVSLRIAREAARTPVVLVIEDLHSADPSTLALIHYVARTTRECGVVVVGTYRPEELAPRSDGPPALVDAMRKMERENLYEHVGLERLTPDGVEKLLDEVLGPGRLAQEVKDRIYRETEGNPFFVLELVRLLDRQGVLPRRGPATVGLAALEGHVPSRVHDIISRRLERLPPEDRDVLEVAAVIGDEFAADILSRALSAEPVSVLRTLRSLGEVHRLIEPSDGRYRFGHVKIREVAYGQVPAELREEYHGAVAAALAGLHRERLEEWAGDIAFHYERSQRPGEALLYLTMAAERAQRQYANEEAIRFSAHAFELEPSETRKSRLAEELGALHSRIGDHERGRAWYRTALTLGAGPRRAAILAGMADIEGRSGRFDESIALCEEALALPDADPQAAAAAQHVMGVACQLRGEFDRAAECFSKSLRIRQDLGDEHAALNTMICMGLLHWVRGDFEPALPYLEDGLRISVRVGDRENEAESLRSLGLVDLERGNYEAALSRFAESLRICERMGSPWGIASCHNNIGLVHARRGEFDEALDHLRRSLDIGTRIGIPWGNAITLNWIGLVHLARGELDTAERCLQESEGIRKTLHDHWGLTHSYCALSQLHLQKGDLETALDFGHQALELAKQLGLRGDEAEARKILGMTHRARGDYEAATAELTASAQMFDRIGMERNLALALYELGLLWSLRDDRAKAREHLSRAESLFQRLGVRDGLRNARTALGTT